MKEARESSDAAEVSVGLGPGTKCSSESTESMLKLLWEATWRVAERRISAEGPTRAGLLPFLWLKPEEVAERAGLDVAVFEELWGTQATSDCANVSAFEAFVIDALGAALVESVKEHTYDALNDHSDDLAEFIRAGGVGEEFDPEARTDHRMALAMSCFSLNPRADYLAYINDIEAMIELTLYGSGLRMKDGLTRRHLTMAIATILEAPWLNKILGMSEPRPSAALAITPDAEPNEWLIDGIGVWAVVSSMTEPVD